VIIEGTKEEIEAKRETLIKAIAKDKLDVTVKMKGQKTFGTKRPPFYKAQKEILKYWDDRFKEMIDSIKKEIAEVIDI
jgi:hypothetical protein